MSDPNLTLDEVLMLGESITLSRLDLHRFTQGHKSAQDAIQRVRELHKPFQDFCVECSRGQKLNGTDDFFVAVPYPCPTIQALDGEQ